MPSLVLIVAAASNNGIGQGGKLPWSIPPDLHYFRDVTLNAPSGQQNAVIMGRYTWDEIPPQNRPLHDRKNVFISKNADGFTKDKAVSLVSAGKQEGESDAVSQAEKGGPMWVAYTFQDAVTHVTETDPAYRIFIIGGASVYKQAIDDARADRILITRILSPNYDNCDVFFPDFQKDPNWKQASYDELKEWVKPVEVPQGKQTYEGIDYEFQMWTRKA